MKKYFLSISLISALLVLSAWHPWRHSSSTSTAPIGGDRDSYGCLIPAGYSFDSEVGACIRAFEMTPNIKRAARMAVEKVGKGYALTVVSFNSYEEVGSYDIVLERGVERIKENVYIRNWQVTETP